ncbi:MULTISPECIES: S1C family serine protease [Corallincola]|uniref:Trypsin n=3 Tax=Corallincola TaxID=1775176 RepID=A0A368NJX8_9GAMM|nr:MULTISPECIES: trypsin-like peptidase domain-containing protein [Corallincola]RCU50400.1 trypsin [Corallincola holothuriorum]TAA48589.1 trypsin-like serine protease [Corallincola spongiicola]TCI05552.1 trypsin-like serine protease [Corallincola luteus]
MELALQRKNTTLPSLLIMAIVMLLTACASNAGEDDVANIFAKVNDSVVELHVKAIQTEKTGNRTSSNGLGSGVLISDSGKVLTAAHVVDTATEVKVIFTNGDISFAKILWIEHKADLAMLKLDKVPEGIKPVKIGDSKTLRIGERIMVIGAPYGVSHSLSVGYVSGRREGPEKVSRNITPVFLQTDAAINKGNSGGPMFNMQGEVIGIVSRILSQSGGFEGLGFAVATQTVQAIIDEGTLPYAGLTALPLTPELARVLNIPQGYGALVQQVVPFSPTDLIGLRPGRLPVKVMGRTLLLGGDVLLAVNGIEIRDEESLFNVRETMQAMEKKDPLVLTILRDGKVITLMETKQ